MSRLAHRLVGGADVGLEPLDERFGRPQEPLDSLLGLGRTEPGARGPVLPVDEAFVAQKLDPGFAMPHTVSGADVVTGAFASRQADFGLWNLPF